VATVGTTAALIFSTGSKRASFVIHADADNTDTILISGVDVAVTHGGDIEELLAGQSISFVNYAGVVYAKSEAGTQTYGIPFVNWNPQVVEKSS
jgi:hypothetical protein